MKTKRFSSGLVVAIAMTTASWLSASRASADTVPFSGSTSVEVPASPAGEMSFTLTVNGQDYDFSDVDNSVGGRLTLTWIGSQQEPRVTIQSCPGGAEGGQILLEEATPSMTVSATWVSATSQETMGPVTVPSREGFATASVCEGNGDESPGEDPDPAKSSDDPEPEPNGSDPVPPPRPEDQEDDDEGEEDDDEDTGGGTHGSGSGSNHGTKKTKKTKRD